MKIKFHTTEGKPHGYLTVGYWWFDQPKTNQGTLHIEVAKMRDQRFYWAVLGHELIEALWCWLRGITTQECDKFDDWMEGEYSSGRIPETFEGGFHKKCPYRIGHIMGAGWEYVCIYGTFASWKKYEANCNEIMNITA